MPSGSWAQSIERGGLRGIAYLASASVDESMWFWGPQCYQGHRQGPPHIFISAVHQILNFFFFSVCWRQLSPYRNIQGMA